MSRSFDVLVKSAAENGWDTEDMLDRSCDFIDAMNALEDVKFPVDSATLFEVWLELVAEKEAERKAAYLKEFR